MAELINANDSLNEGRKKLNESIKQSESAEGKSAQAINTSNEAKDISQTAEEKADSVQEQFNQVVIAGDSSVEAAQARVDEKGQSHSTLKQRIDKGFSETTAQLAQTERNLDAKKLDKNRGAVTSADLSQEVKEQMTGGSVAVVGENSVLEENIVDKQVTPKKTSFINGQYKRIYPMEDKSGILAANLLNFQPRTTGDGPFLNVIPIQPKRDYRIEITDVPEWDRTRAFIFNSYPEEEQDSDDVVINDDSYKGVIEFTNTKSGKYLLLYLNSTLYEASAVPFKVFEKKQYLDEKEVSLSPRTVEPKHTNFFLKSKNLYFNGQDYKGFLSRGTDEEGNRITQFKTDPSSPNAVSRIIPIEPNKTYTITPLEGVDRFRYAISTEHIVPTKFYGIAFYPRPQIIDYYEGQPFESFTFQNSDEGRYLILYLSSEGQEVKCQVEKGAKATEYEQEYILDEDYFRHSIEVENYANDHQPYFDIASLPMQYNIHASAELNVSSYLNSTTHDFIYNIFDDLVTEFPEYVTKTYVRDDVVGNPIYRYKFKPSQINTNIEIKYTKILVAAGVHGREKTTPYMLSQFFSGLCREWKTNSQLDWLRHNIEFIVQPVCSPSAYDLTDRHTANGVNINRNFPWNWVETEPGTYDHGGLEPFSEPETLAIKDMIDNNKDAEFYIDCHNFTLPKDGAFLWFPSPMEDVEYFTFANKYSSTMARKWAKDFSWMPTEKIAYTDINRQAWSTTYGIQQGIKSYTLEIDYTIAPSPSSVSFNQYNILIAIEHFGNFVIGLLKEMKGKDTLILS